MDRISRVIDNQVRALRKQQAIDAFEQNLRDGAYWGIRSDISHFHVHEPLPCPPSQTSELAKIHTRLGKLAPDVQKRLINWGYAVADAAMRKHVEKSVPPPRDFPYPEQRVGPRA